jgi:hypothetical protein
MQVNTRRVMYLGSALKLKDQNLGWWYGVGDTVPQMMPSCIDMPGKDSKCVIRENYHRGCT